MTRPIAVETPVCIHCGHSAILFVDPAELAAFEAGAFAQDAFPNTPAPIREQFISGTHPACWDTIFADENEE